MVSIFFSYSHKDEELRNELEAHLALLKRQGIISAWYDHCIIAGDEIDQVISSELESAKIILLLVSAHFLASDYCYEKEMKRGLEKHNDGTAVVIPVILHPCDWHSAPFGNLRATPTDGKPVSMFANQQEAFSIIAKDIREATKVFLEPNAPLQGSSGDGNSEVTRYTGERSSNLRIKR
ncbi:MAG: toll/interleukin-1 receptor domain-containing protein, partial [Methanobacterium sp.]